MLGNVVPEYQLGQISSLPRSKSSIPGVRLHLCSTFVVCIYFGASVEAAEQANIPRSRWAPSVPSDLSINLRRRKISMVNLQMLAQRFFTLECLERCMSFLVQMQVAVPDPGSVDIFRPIGGVHLFHVFLPSKHASEV